MTVLCERPRTCGICFFFPLIVLTSGRFLNLDCATGYPSVEISYACADQVLAQPDLLRNLMGKMEGERLTLAAHAGVVAHSRPHARVVAHSSPSELSLEIYSFLGDLLTLFVEGLCRALTGFCSLVENGRIPRALYFLNGSLQILVSNDINWPGSLIRLEMAYASLLDPVVRTFEATRTSMRA